MKKFFIVLIFLLIILPLFSDDTLGVEEYRGYQWEKLFQDEKINMVGSILAGFSIWRDYIFDLITNAYDHYQSFDMFLERDEVISKIVEDLDRYYIINRDNYKYDDRVVTMIVVFYGKYWWKEIPVNFE